MGVISSGIYVKVESDNTSISGKVREYDTYQDMLNESEDIAFAIVQDASADGTIVLSRNSDIIRKLKLEGELSDITWINKEEKKIIELEEKVNIHHHCDTDARFHIGIWMGCKGS